MSVILTSHTAHNNAKVDNEAKQNKYQNNISTSQALFFLCVCVGFEIQTCTQAVKTHQGYFLQTTPGFTEIRQKPTAEQSVLTLTSYGIEAYDGLFRNYLNIQD